MTTIQPTFSGYVHTTQDALILFQAAISGVLPTVSRRPHDKERNEIIQSGSVFIFNEQSSGIKRWTDGIAWSPSRILGNFLIYRQLDKPFAPGEKKRTAHQERRRRHASSHGSLDMGHPYAYGSSRHSVVSSGQTIIDPHTGVKYDAGYDNMNIPGHQSYRQNYEDSGADDSDSSDRYLVGSLVDSYIFKKDGLIKKTISIPYQGQHHHLVSYYRPSDVQDGLFISPSEDANLKDIAICEELQRSDNFRIAVDAEEAELNSSRSLNQIKRDPSNQVLNPTDNYTTRQADKYYQHNLSVSHGRSNEMTSYDDGMEHPYYYQQSAVYQQSPVATASSRPYTGYQQSQSSTGAMYHSGVAGPTAATSSSGQHNGYVSGYRPFGAATLPAPQQSNATTTSWNSYNNNLNSSTGSSLQMQAPHSGTGSHGYPQQASQMPLDIYYGAHPVYQYSSPTSGLAVGSVTSGSISPNYSISAPSVTSGRQNPGSGAQSPSYPVVSPSQQSYAYQTYGHEYSGMGVGLSSDPRRLPNSSAAPSPAHQPTMGETAGAYVTSNGTEQQKSFATKADSTESVPVSQGSTYGSYGYNYSHVAPW